MREWMSMSLSRHARILVIDDDETLSSSVRELLEDAGGYHVEVASKPDAALHTAREFQPDLVLLDLDLPGTDSASVAAAFRTDPQMRKARILFLGAMRSPGPQGFRNGAYFLAQPVQSAPLLRAIGRELVTPGV